MIPQILIAHKNEAYTKTLVKMLKSKGLEGVLVADNGFKALEYIIKFKPVIILIDIDLPGLQPADIEKAMRFKRIKSKLLIIKPEDIGALENVQKILPKMESIVSC